MVGRSRQSTGPHIEPRKDLEAGAKTLADVGSPGCLWTSGVIFGIGLYIYIYIYVYTYIRVT